MATRQFTLSGFDTTSLSPLTGGTATSPYTGQAADALVCDKAVLALSGASLSSLSGAKGSARLSLAMNGVTMVGTLTEANEAVVLSGVQAQAFALSSGTATLTVTDISSSMIFFMDVAGITAVLTLTGHSLTDTMELGGTTMDAGDNGGVTIYLGAAASADRKRQLKYTLGTRSMVWPAAVNGVAQYLPGTAINTLLKVPLAWVDQFPTSSSMVGTLAVLTYNGDVLETTMTRSLRLTCPESLCPTVVSAKCQANRLQTVDGVTYTLPTDVWVQEHSALSAVMAADAVSATGLYGATIVKTGIRFGSWEASGAPGAARTLTTGWIPDRGELDVVFYATDSRGCTGKAVLQLSVLTYNRPHIQTFTARRVNASGEANDLGEYAWLSHFVVIPSSGGTGGSGYESDPSYTMTQTLTVDGVVVTANGSIDEDGATQGMAMQGGAALTISKTTSHVAKLVVEESLGTRLERSITIPSGRFLIHGNATGDGLGLGEAAEGANMLSVNPAWEIKYKGQGLDARMDDRAAAISKAAVAPLASFAGLKVQYGAVTVSVAANSTAGATVTFDTPFSSTPNVVACPQASVPSYYQAGVSGRSATGFTVRLASTYNSNVSVSMQWIAIGQ